VAYAHSREVVHRDLKPENIMLGDFGETVLLDWGLARMEGMDEGSVTPAGPEELRKRAERRLRAQGVNTSRLTLDGSVMGTPAYMPPEQASGKLTEIDERSDVYSLGAILYEIITGKQPYTGDSALEVIDAVLAGPPTKIGALCPEAPPELVSVCEQAMARERDNRIASSKELGDEITAWRDGRALRSYRYSAWEHVRRVMRGHWDAAGVAAIALVALLGFGLWSYNRIHAENDDLQNAKAAAEREHNEALEREKRLQDTIDRLTREHAEKAGTPQPGAGK
jgi:serine/threonine protein kinase